MRYYRTSLLGCFGGCLSFIILAILVGFIMWGFNTALGGLPRAVLRNLYYWFLNFLGNVH